jgi:hypothetical protein
MTSFIYFDSRGLDQIYVERSFSANYKHSPDRQGKGEGIRLCQIAAL